MPDIIQCKLCSKPFQSVGGSICYHCLGEIDDAFIKIRDFLYDNPEKSTIDEIAEATDTPRKIVIHLIQEGRLSASDSDYNGPVCPYCRRPVSNGAMCDKCRRELSDTLLKSIPKREPNMNYEKSKMHIDFGKRR